MRKSLLFLALMAPIAHAQSHALAWSRFDQSGGAGSVSQQPIGGRFAPNGRFVVAGTAYDPSTSKHRVWVSQYSRSSSLIWSRWANAPGEVSSFAKALVIDDANRTWVAGQTGDRKLHLVCWDANGVEAFNREYDFSPSRTTTEAHGMRLDPQGFVYVHGLTDYMGGRAGFVAKMFATGDISILRTLLEPANYRTFLTFQGSNPIFGWTTSDPNNRTFRLTKLGANLETLSEPGLTGLGTFYGTGLATAGGKLFYTATEAGFDYFGNTDDGTQLATNDGNGLVVENRVITVEDHARHAVIGLSHRGNGATRNDLVFRRWLNAAAPAYSGGLLAGTGETLEPRAGALDGLGETLAAVQSRVGTTYQGVVAKFSATAGLRWQYRTLSTWGKTLLAGIAVEPLSGDVLLVGHGDHPTESHRTRVFMLRQAPLAYADSYTVAKNVLFRSPRPVTINDRNALGSTITVVTPPTRGTLNLSNNGSFTYTPNANYVGTDRFTYRLAKTGTTSSNATVTLTIR